MKVFISWSGDHSREIGDVFRRWLPAVLQAVRPYFSPDDISKGSRWESEVSKELAASRMGLLILTPENIEASWLVFEAGALAKNLEKSRVCPLLFDLEPTDIKGPLVQFQAARFEQSEIKRVVKMINKELGEQGLDNSVLDGVFEMWWPTLKTGVAEILKQPVAKKGERSERDILEEILGLTRSASRRGMWRSASPVNQAPVRDIIDTLSILINEPIVADLPRVTSLVRELSLPIAYIVRKYGDPRTVELAVSKGLLSESDADKKVAAPQNDEP